MFMEPLKILKYKFLFFYGRNNNKLHVGFGVAIEKYLNQHQISSP